MAQNPSRPIRPRDEPLVFVLSSSPTTSAAVAMLLGDEGFLVRTAPLGRESLEVIARLRPALVLLQGPAEDALGLRVVELVRRATDVPLVVLRRPTDPGQVSLALELGADDYLATPFDPDELTARVRAVLRRSHRSPSGSQRLAIGRVTVDFENRLAYRDGRTLRLSPAEWLIVRRLAEQPGQVVLNTNLLEEVWGDGYDVQVLRVTMSRLRRKLGSTRSAPIKTYHNVGYALELDGARAIGAIHGP